MESSFNFSNKLQSFFEIENHPHPNEPHKVPNYVFSRSIYKPLPSAKLLLLSKESASLLDIDPKILAYDSDILQMLSGGDLNKINCDPVSHNYSGHQFGQYVGQLGDGRSVSLGDYVNKKGEKWELNIKGSGKTAFSREADGRSMLRSCVKEFLFSEYMNKIGVPTIAALSVFGSFDEKVDRDLIFAGKWKLEPAGVVCRLSPNYIRVGSFEIGLEDRLFQGEGWESQEIIKKLLNQMVDFVLEFDFKEISKSDSKKVEKFYEEVVKRTAKLAACWQSCGFCHGALNTDNISIMGLTLDYETSGFLEVYNPDFNPNSMDYSGRHCYKEQPGVLAWDLVKLAEALKLISDFSENISTLKKCFMETCQNEYNEKMRTKMGFLKKDDTDIMIIRSFLKLMENSKADFTKAFRFLSSGDFFDKEERMMEEIGKFCMGAVNRDDWIKFRENYRKRIEKEGEKIENIQERMKLVNPRYIIRAQELREAMELLLEEEGNMTGVDKIYSEILNVFQ